MSKTTIEAQILIIFITAIGTLLAQAGLEWIKNFLQARDRRQQSSDAVVIKQIDIDDHVRQDLHEWWQEQVKESKAQFERAVKAEAERDNLQKEIARLRRFLKRHELEQAADAEPDNEDEDPS